MPCTTILVGNKASYDGSTIIARNDDGAFEAKKMMVIERNQPSKYKCIISHLEIDLPKKSYRYTACPNVDKHRGAWPACGINEKNVAMTATETTTSNSLVLGADPLVVYKKEGNKVTPGGIGEEDLLTIVLPYVSSAREAVLRTGELLEKYGTYESNGMAFSDEKEVWWLESIGGHHFMAVRVPDEKIVLMPNYFGLDYFDLKDAYSKQVSNICSKDLKDFIKNNHLDRNNDGKFNPKIIFGSHSFQDHLYNTPRAWYLLKYFNPTTYDWINNPKYSPISDDIPFSTVPERKVSIEDIKYILSSHYQSSEYDPYSKASRAGAYRSIGVPNTDCMGILQIRPYMPKELKGIEWMCLGGSAFTACFGQYVNVDSFNPYISRTTKEVSTDNMYWNSRLIAALTDAAYKTNVIEDERYQNAIINKCNQIIHEYDEKMLKSKDYSLCKEANDKIIEFLKTKTKEILNKVLLNASNNMKTRYHREDN